MSILIMFNDVSVAICPHLFLNPLTCTKPCNHSLSCKVPRAISIIDRSRTLVYAESIDLFIENVSTLLIRKNEKKSRINIYIYIYIYIYMYISNLLIY